ncbi:MAG: NAD(P)H-hydrate dehydratase [Pirellula sp.]|nr:NAD(P)H-hydrate dehydratase [Pirellula sp.]
MIDPATLSDRGKQILSATRPSGLTLLKPRDVDGHKGTYGRALIVGGSLGMAGAVGLSGMAALRAGAGLVRLAVPRGIVSIVASYEPAYMTTPLAEDDDGRLHRSATASLMEATKPATVVAVGPGLGRGAGVSEIALRLFAEVKQPAVFDADALNALAEHRNTLSTHIGPRILTPHPGEFERLVGGRKFADRSTMCEAAAKLAADTQTVIVLKGHGTFVTDGTRGYTNTTGNPGMATGGTGDVLTGILTALLCQEFEPWDAACLGVFVHGLAGDLAAADLGMPSLIASDLIRYLPPAVQSAIAAGK